MVASSRSTPQKTTMGTPSTGIAVDAQSTNATAISVRTVGQQTDSYTLTTLFPRAMGVRTNSATSRRSALSVMLRFTTTWCPGSSRLPATQHPPQGPYSSTHRPVVRVLSTGRKQPHTAKKKVVRTRKNPPQGPHSSTHRPVVRLFSTSQKQPHTTKKKVIRTRKNPRVYWPSLGQR